MINSSDNFRGKISTILVQKKLFSKRLLEVEEFEIAGCR